MIKQLLTVPSQISEPIGYTGNSWKFDGDTLGLDFLSTPYLTLYGPSGLYSNGRTYYTTKTNPYTTVQTFGIVEYYQGNTNIVWMDRATDSEDRHDYGYLVDDGTGRITLLAGQHWPSTSMGRVEVWKMAAANDINSFEYKGLSSEFGDYCKPYYRSSDDSIICIGRRDPLSTGGDGNLYMSIFDNDTTWSTPIQITEHEAIPPVSGEPRYYPTCLQGHDNDDDWGYYFFSRRLGETFGEINYIYREHLCMKFQKTNPYVIYNLSGNFSKDIDTNGPLTWTELNDNFVYVTNLVEHGGNSKGLFISVNEIYQQIHYNGERTLFKYNGSAWSNEGGIEAVSYIDKYNSVNVKDNNTIEFSTLLNAKKYTSNDIFSDLINGIWQENVPANCDDIPKGEKYAVACGSLKNGNNSTVDNTNENDLFILEFIR